MSLTKEAFARFRQIINTARPPRPNLIANSGETRLMTSGDGLNFWFDGSCSTTPASPPPRVPDNFKDITQLWVVRFEDVAYAQENCAFGKSLPSGVIKHTNLTGGLPAYCGGELIQFDSDTLIVNGYSGRYGPQTPAELIAVAKAFKESGYAVCHMGWDEEVGRANPFVGLNPNWI